MAVEIDAKKTMGSKSDDVEQVPTNVSLATGSFDHDAAKLAEMGYAAQMPREFSIFELVAAGFAVTASWLGVVGGFSTGVITGGPVCLVWGIVIMLVLQLLVVTSLSELVSAMPNAGGQYYWAMRLAPAKLSRISAYATGWFNLAGGVCAGAANVILFGYMIFGCVLLYNPDFTFHAWQVWLVGLSVYYTCAAFNLSEKSVAASVTYGSIFLGLAFFVTLVTLPAKANSHTSASFIFTSTENFSGWSSTGVAFLLGLINSNYAFGLIDTGVHLAEEIVEPEKNVPKALYCTVLVGFVTAWPLTIVLMYCLTDFESVAGTATGVPLLQLYYLIFNSRAPAVIFLAMVIVSFACATIALQAYQARVCWSFSRDNGLPFAKFWSQVHPTLCVPINAHLLCITVVSILSILPIASTTAFNSMVTGVVVFPYLSFMTPVAYSLLPANRHIKGPFNLGVFGTFARVATILFSLYSAVIYCLPFVMPVTGSNMNYFSVVLAVILILMSIDWLLRGRRTFGHEGIFHG